MSRNNNCTTGNRLDFGYFKENYRLTVIDLSKKTKSKDFQQINFIGKLENQNVFQNYKILSTPYKNGNAKDYKFVKQFWK